MNKIITNTTNCASDAIYAAQAMEYNRKRTLAEAFSMIQMGINDIAANQLRSLCTAIINSKDKDKRTLSIDYGVNGVRHEAELIMKDLREYDKKLLEVLKSSCTIKEEGMTEKTYDDLMTDIANALDTSDELLERHVKAIKEFVDRHTPIGGDCCPLDPWLLKQLMVCDITCGLAKNVFEKNIELERAMSQPLFSFMNYKTIYGRLGRIWAKIPLKNKYGKPLRYNAIGVLRHKDLIGQLDKNGRIDDGVIPHMRDTIYSTNYIDKCLFARDGKDYNFRAACPSLVQGLHGDKSIKIDAA